MRVQSQGNAPIRTPLLVSLLYRDTRGDRCTLALKVSQILSQANSSHKLPPMTELKPQDTAEAYALFTCMHAGPTDNSTEDFWRMVWEQRVPTIVMLTRIFEGKVSEVVAIS